MNRLLPVPDEMKHRLFFDGEMVPLPVTADLGHMKAASQFPYEILYWNGLDGCKPWLDPASSFRDLLHKWEGVYKEGHRLFSARKKSEAGDYVREGAAVFISALFWVNGQPVHLTEWEQRTAQFPVQPLNTAERLRYILGSTARYSSLIQLNELLEELVKKQSAALLKQKKKRL